MDFDFIFVNVQCDEAALIILMSIRLRKNF